MFAPRSGGGRRLAGMFDQRSEQTLLGAVEDQELRMPLDADHQPLVGGFDPLDDFVAVDGIDFDIVTKIVDGLMMQGIHHGRVGSEDFFQLTIRLDFHLLARKDGSDFRQIDRCRPPMNHRPRH